ncbi:MAG: LamG domain-containing protein, partial [Patescibacteria group bacterium]
ENGLVGYWPFNEGRGVQASDSSNSGNTGTLTGGVSWTDGKRGKALSFNGTTGYVSTSLQISPAQYTSLTMSAWVYPTAQSGLGDTFKSILNGDDGGYDRGFGIRTSHGNYEVQVGDTSWNTGVAYSTNAWDHIVVVYTASQISIYKNGTATNYGSGGTFGASTQGLLIAEDTACGTCYFAGKIDDVRIYNRALSATGIQTLYKQNEATANTNTNSRITSGLVGLWSFNGYDLNMASTTAEILDRSGQNNNGDNAGGRADAGSIGQGWSFDGADDNIAITGTTAFNRVDGEAMSVSAWIKPARLAGQYQELVASRSNSGTYNWMLYQHTTGGEVSFHGNLQYKSDYIPPLNVWTHVVATVTTGGVATLYANGSVVQTNSYNYHVATPNALNFGTTGTDLSEDYQGLLDEVRVYNRALTADEVKQLYNMGK